jgi:hypothetical protein
MTSGSYPLLVYDPSLAYPPDVECEELIANEAAVVPKRNASATINFFEVMVQSP